MVKDLKEFGLHEEAAAYAARPKPGYEIWPENADMLKIFIALATQWRCIGSMASISYQGLEYSAIKSTLELMAIKRKKWPEIFSNLQMMEAAALKVLNEKDVD